MTSRHRVDLHTAHESKASEGRYGHFPVFEFDKS